MFAGILVFVLNTLLTIFEKELYNLSVPLYGIILMVTIFVLLLLTIICLSRQPQAITNNSFQVPLVPYIPFVSIFANTHLMVHLNILTWYRFIGWMILGFIIYFSYGIVKSVGYLTQKEKQRLLLEGNDARSSEDVSQT